MARICDVTGKRTRFGNNVSHANNRLRRKFLPNLHKKRFFVPSTGGWITLTVSSTALRTIRKLGLVQVLKNNDCLHLLKQK